MISKCKRISKPNQSSLSKGYPDGKRMLATRINFSELDAHKASSSGLIVPAGREGGGLAGDIFKAFRMRIVHELIDRGTRTPVAAFRCNFHGCKAPLQFIAHETMSTG